eukprot:SAG31_NODE_2291_length_5998_cov_175.153077_2_plen_70_part_00
MDTTGFGRVESTRSEDGCNDTSACNKPNDQFAISRALYRGDDRCMHYVKTRGETHMTYVDATLVLTLPY